MPQQYPEPTVGALIVGPDGKILLMRSHKWRGEDYCIPGGHIELGERIEDAVVREAREETGLKVSDLEFLCFQEYVYGESFWEERRHFIFFDYACRTDSTDVVLNDEAESHLWVDPEAVGDLPVHPLTANVIAEYVRRRNRQAE